MTTRRDVGHPMQLAATVSNTKKNNKENYGKI